MITRHRLPTMAQGDFPASRWEQLRADLDAFVGSEWAAEAERLGWTELDLYGVDANRPYVRIDGRGLVPALDGCRIIELNATGAVLETPGGAQQSYRRKGDQPGRAPVWALVS